MSDLIPVAVALPDRTPAPAVVVIHGQGSCKEHWLGELSHYAAAGIIGVALDVRGHGGRRQRELDTTVSMSVPHFLELVEGTATDIREVIDSLSATPGWDGRVAVWGYSMGAAIALLAAAADRRVSAAALIGLPLQDAGGGATGDARGDRRPVDGGEQAGLERQSAIRALAEGIGGRSLLFVHGSLDDDYQRVCGLFSAMADTGARAAMLAYHGGDQPPPDVLDTVRDWTVGALLRAGTGVVLR
jgi:pimeloyl-ACP methyl ester carboxylesterase